MKRKLLFLMLVLTWLYPVGMNAMTGTQLTSANVLDCFLYNVGGDQFLTAGDWWGTHAAAGTAGMDLDLTYKSAGVYTIGTRQEGSKFMNGVWMDAATCDFTFTEIDATNHYYTISYVDGSSNTQYIYYTGSTIDQTTTTPNSNNYYWQVVTRANFISSLNGATSANPKDATSAVYNAGFFPLDYATKKLTDFPANRSWQGTQLTDTWGYRGDAAGVNGGNYCVEQFNKSFDNYQSLTGMPNGAYIVSNQGFYRGTTPAYLYLNSTKTAMEQLAADTSTEPSAPSGYDTNGIQKSSYAFGIADNYHNETVPVVVTDGNVRIGVTTDGETANWSCFDNFQLQYLGVPSASNPIDMTGYIVNPNMEADGDQGYDGTVTGWTYTTEATNHGTLNGQTGAFTGHAFENWKSGGLTDGKIYQTVTGMPDGVYKFDLAAMVRTTTNQFIYVKSNNKTFRTYLSAANETAAAYSVYAIASGGSMEIGLDINASGIDWAAIDNAGLTYYGTSAEAYELVFNQEKEKLDAVVAALTDESPLKTAISNVSTTNASPAATVEGYTAAINAMLPLAHLYPLRSALAEACQWSAWAQTMASVEYSETTDGSHATFATAITSHTTTINSTVKTAADIATANNTLRTAMLTYLNNATPTIGNEFNLTGLVTNPNFEMGDKTGWTNTGTTLNVQNTDWGGKVGTYLLRGWGVSGDTDISNTLASMPAGLYKITATIQHHGTDESSSLKLHAGDNEFDVPWKSGRSDYSVYAILSEAGNLTFGLRGTLATTWLLADNFRITYLGIPSASNTLDRSSLITNPGFESALSGWTNGGSAIFAARKSAAFTMRTGSNYAWAHTAGTVDMYQTVNSLPAGLYRVSANAQSTNDSNDVKLYAASAEKKVTTAQGYSVFVNLTSPGSLTFGIKGTIVGGEADVDDFTLTYYGVPSTTNAVNMTNQIINPDMEADGDQGFGGTVTGWTYTTEATNHGTLNGQTGAFTSHAFENWKGGGLTDGQIYQTVTGIPDGVYKLDLAALVRTVDKQSIYAKSNGKTFRTYLSGAGSTAAAYSVYAIASGSSLEIGLDINASGIDWAAIDNAALTYYGTGADAYELVHTQEKTLLNTIAGELTAGSLKTAVEGVYTTNATPAATVDGYTTAINNMNPLNDGNVELIEASRLSVGANDLAGVAYSEMTDGSHTTFTTAIDAHQSAILAATSATGITTANNTLLTAIGAYLQGATPSAADTYFDITFLMVNPNFSQANNATLPRWMWQGAPGIAGNGTNNNAEKYNTTFDVYQTIPALPTTGMYRLTTQAYYRPGANDNASTAQHALLYIGDTYSTPLMNIATEGTNAQDNANGFTTANTNTGSTVYVPNGQNDASLAFTYGLSDSDHDYLNTLDFAIIEPSIARKVGVKKTEQIAADWTLFDNFRLYYLGTEAPAPTLPTGQMYATAKEEMNTAFNTWNTTKNAANYDAMNEKINAAKASVELYKQIKDFSDRLQADAQRGDIPADTMSAMNFVTRYSNGEVNSVADATTGTYETLEDMLTEYKANIVSYWRAPADNADLTAFIINQGIELAGAAVTNPTGWSFFKDTDKGDCGTRNTAVTNMSGWHYRGARNQWDDGIDLQQSIRNLPLGEYKLTATLAGLTDATAIKLTVNGEEATITNAGDGTGVEVSIDNILLTVDPVINIKVDGGKKEGSTLFLADNFRLIYNGIKPLLKYALDEAKSIYDANANVGDDVFQIPTSVREDLKAAYDRQKPTYDGGSVSFVAGMMAIMDLDGAMAVYESSVVPPTDGKQYYLKVATSGHSKENKYVATTLGATGDNNRTGYQFNANALDEDNVALHKAQTFKFTKKGVYEYSNTYYISIERPEGEVWLTYGSLNSSAAGWAPQQIQGTTEIANRGEFIIRATTTDNQFHIENTEYTGTGYVICQNESGNIFTEDASGAEFTLVEATPASVTVSCKTSKYGTVIFPFTPNIAGDSDFDNIDFYTCNRVDGETAKVSGVAKGSLQAQIPYLIYNRGGSDFTKTVSDYGIVTEEDDADGDADADTYGLLTGTYTAQAVPVSDGSTNYYVLQTKPTTGQAFYKVTSAFTSTAYKAYMTVESGGSPVKAFFLGFDELDGINNIEFEEEEKDGTVIYNLAGQRVANTQKGIYIKNGKKVVVR